MMENKDKKKSIKEFKNIYKLIKEDKGKLIFAFICVFLSSMLSITNGWLQGKVTEEIVAKNLKTSLIFLLIYFMRSSSTSSRLAAVRPSMRACSS